jgi:3-phosphoshikimate 1-carboxyvinyltransferase
MIQTVRPLAKGSMLSGSVLIPASKSHTIRALLIAALADGTSLVINPLDSKDARSCVETITAFGATVEELAPGLVHESRAFRITGVGDGKKGLLKEAPSNVIDTGNSGTTIYLAAGMAALCPGYTVFTGDHQIRNRPIGNLLRALRDFGAEAFATRGNDCAPAIIRGPLLGGSTTISCPTSQFLSSLLLALPLAEGSSEINITLLHEQPYAEMTLRWLDEQGIHYENVDQAWRKFRIPGGQRYTAFRKVVPGDFSSATFFACAAAITGSMLVLEGLDMADSQGDKAVFGILEAMGCVVRYDPANSAQGITVIGPGHGDNPTSRLLGGEFDLNAIPDALPALSVTACFAQTEVRLVNVPQARLKETDRIAVMCLELNRMGGKATEREDGLILQPAQLFGTDVEGHDDHRVVMSLSLAALRAEGETRIHGAEAAAVTFPDFFTILQRLGAHTSSQGAAT